MRNSQPRLVVARQTLYPFSMNDSSASEGVLGDGYRKLLTSAKVNVHVDSWRIAWEDLTPECPFPWVIQKKTLHGGKQEGVDIIEVDNGLLDFSVVPTRGMGLHEARLGDLRLGWHSPVKEIVHPQYVNLESRGGLGWLEGFNEWVVRCGLEFAGAPGRDRFITNTGDEAEMELTLHGKIANIPASEVEVSVDDRQSPPLIMVAGQVDERMFYGPKLELLTVVSTKAGSKTIRLKDTVTNRSASEQEFQLIYHCNFGPPLLEEGARFSAPVRRVWPINQHAAPFVRSYDEYQGPTASFVEQVYCIDLLSGMDGMATVVLRNKDSEKAVAISFSTKQLPWLTLWKNTAAVEEGYVTGIEPGTGFPYNRRVERESGRVPKLEPGETRTFTIDFTILDSASEVSREVALVEEIQSGFKPVFSPSPPGVA